jgi:hypothetical protein
MEFARSTGDTGTRGTPALLVLPLPLPVLVLLLVLVLLIGGSTADPETKPMLPT